MDYRCPFFEVSAKDGSGVEEAFLQLAGMLAAGANATGVTYRQPTMSQVVLDEPAKDKKKKKECCLD